MRSSIGLHALDSNMIRRHDAANTVKPDERRPREQRKGWPSAEKNDENESARVKTLVRLAAGRRLGTRSFRSHTAVV